MSQSVTNDRLQRPLRDLRISVTDRCNMRCTYCMPADRYHDRYVFLPRENLLTFEELARIARIACGLGVEKVRVTGGEPLLRRDLSAFIAMIARETPATDIALTTNGLLLPRFAAALREAGLQRVTVSLDSLRDEVFQRINGGRGTVAEVLAGIEAAKEAGFDHIKVNCVVQRGVNEADIVPLAERFRGSGITLRFIEFMDVGTLNRWTPAEVVPAEAIRDRLSEHYALRPCSPSYPGEVAQRYAYADGAGEVGIIASVTQPFCGGCTRLRLAADGTLFTCLFARDGVDLLQAVRGGATDDEVVTLLTSVWRGRSDQYSVLRGENADPQDKIEMYHIGG